MIYLLQVKSVASECLPRMKCTPQQCGTQSWSYHGFDLHVCLIYMLTFPVFVSYRSAVNRIDHQSNDHPQDVFPLPHTIPRISIWFQWFVIALPHWELQLLWHSHQNFIAYLINYFCKEVHFPPKRLPHSITTKSEKKLKLCEVLLLNCGVGCHHIFLYFRCLAAAPPMSSSTRWHWIQEAYTGQQLASHFAVFDVCVTSVDA